MVRFALKGSGHPGAHRHPARDGPATAGGSQFGSDGMLYIGTGDAGRPALSADRRSLAGKVLRVTAFGRPAPGNPDPASPVYSLGHGALAGLCLGGPGQVYVTEPALGGRGRGQPGARRAGTTAGRRPPGGPGPARRRRTARCRRRAPGSAGAR